MDSKKSRWQVLFMVYNGLILAASFFLLPLIIYSVCATDKRRQTFRQRMGWCHYPWQQNGLHDPSDCIWVHALSVGEVQAAQALVTRLRTSRPNLRICFSASTHTGFQTAEQLFGHQKGIDLLYFPYDWLWAVRKVATQINPSMVILTETDIWPNFLMEMRRRKVPVCLVNLRISDGSWKNYRRFKSLARIILGGFEKIGVQGHKDLDRLIFIGIPAERIVVAGNIKFDCVTENSAADSGIQKRRELRIPSGKQIVIAGSTHEGEEKVLIEILRHLKLQVDTPVLILAPRDPLRSSEILKLCLTKGLSCDLLSCLIKESRAADCPQVVVVDSIGVLKGLYSLADIVFIGGSLVPCGGHNPLEPAAWGKPILFGPDMRDFQIIAGLLQEAQAARQVANADELCDALKRMLTDPQSARQMGHRALRVFNAHRGAVDKTLEFLGLLPTLPE